MQPCVTLPETQQRKLVKKQKTQEHYHNRAANDLSKLKEGNVVRIKPTRLGHHEWREATVTSCLDKTSYLVETEDGGQYRRNRVHLRKSKETTTIDDETDPMLIPQDTEMMIPTNDGAEEQAPDTSEHIEPPQQTTPKRPQRQRSKPCCLQDYDC